MNDNNINIVHDRITRKLTASVRHAVQQDLAGQPGIPSIAPRIARKAPELLTPIQQQLWDSTMPVYARYCTQWKQICAILPAYLLDGTNGTIVYYIDGSCDVLSNRITWVLNDLFEYMLTSKSILERQSIRWMGGIDRRRVPLVVNDTFALVPVTCRQAQRRNDGTTGYVVLQHLYQVLPGAEWRRLHRDEEDLLSDYDNVLNRPKSEEDEVSILILQSSPSGAKPLYIRDAYKLALRDNSNTVLNNIILAHRMLEVREYTLWDGA